MKLLALKIDVDTYRGTREGVPRLLEALQKRNANATFLFSLGPDHTGRAIKRVFRPGFMKKVSRTSVLEHYGLRTLLYGTLLIGPDIGLRCADILRGVRAAGFETGVHVWDHIRWQDGVALANAEWTLKELALAARRYEDVFGVKAPTHGAAGWQMNRTAFRWQQQAGLQYASDTRGESPFWPVLEGEPVQCLQMPTTLPTLDELIGVDGLSVDNVHEHLLRKTQEEPAHGHVYTLHAELEGMKLLPVFERLLDGWMAQGYQLVAMVDLYKALDVGEMPYCDVTRGEVPGRSGDLALQGAVFPG